MSEDDTLLGPIVYDNPKEKGIDIIINISEGLTFNMFMTDDAAQDFADIIQNKINSRL